MKSRLYTILRVVVSLGFLGLLFYMRRKDLGVIIKTVYTLDAAPFILGCIIYLSSTLIFAQRLRLLFNGQGLVMGLGYATYLTFLGYFFNNFLPTAVGGDLAKIYFAYKRTNHKLNSFIAVFMDRFLGFVTLFAMAAISLVFCYKIISDRYIVWLVLAILALLAFLLAVLLNRGLARVFSPAKTLLERLNLRKHLQKLYDAGNAYRNKKSLILKVILISFAGQIVCFYVVYLMIHGIKAFMPLNMVLLLMPVVSIISMLPSISGHGIREWSIYILFGPYIGYEKAFTLSILWLFLIIIISAIGGILLACNSSLRGAKRGSNLKEIASASLRSASQ